MLKSIGVAWKNRNVFGDASRERELAAFLPAALEIQEMPPNPLVHWVGWALIMLFVSAVVWAFWGQVNVVATAEGKIIPSSRVKQVQPLEKGVVKAIFVSEGSYVTKGQPLIELDKTLTLSDKKRLLSDLKAVEAKEGINNALLALIEKNKGESIQVERAYSEVLLQEIFGDEEGDADFYRQWLWQRWEEYVSKLRTLQSALDKTRSEQLASRESVVKLEKTLPLIIKRAEKFKVLFDKSFVSEMDFLNAEQERIQKEQDLSVERHRYQQLIAQERQVKEQKNNFIAETKSNLLEKIAEQKERLAVLQEEIVKVNDINSRQILYAPVSGRVQEMAAYTVGGVVTEAQQLMLVVPDEGQMEVEVYLENKDIGFVYAGMPAEIKVHTFPFTKYGSISANVVNVSTDAVVDERQGLVYSMQLRMNKNKMDVDGRLVSLVSGMAVTAEVQIGKRRIIEFFLAPLLRYKNESIRER